MLRGIGKVVSSLIPRWPQVSVIRLSGVIGEGKHNRLNLENVEKALEKGFNVGSQQHLKAVALVINSPGGSPVQSSLLFQRVKDLKKSTDERRAKMNLEPVPVLAFVEDVAASGGYYVACAADEIIVDRSSIVGSIGVILSLIHI